jgi:hypothetical protein
MLAKRVNPSKKQILVGFKCCENDHVTFDRLFACDSGDSGKSGGSGDYGDSGKVGMLRQWSSGHHCITMTTVAVSALLPLLLDDGSGDSGDSGNIGDTSVGNSGVVAVRRYETALTRISKESALAVISFPPLFKRYFWRN